MLRITVPKNEMWDPNREEFISIREQSLALEHSLVSLSKWEAEHKKPFLTNKAKTLTETADYVRCMTLTQNVDDNVYKCLSAENLNAVNSYIDDPMTATVINDRSAKRGGSEFITSELIYYWMIAFNIPFECQKWHLNRLLTLIRVCEVKSRDPKRNKMRNADVLKQYAAINAARRKTHK